MKRSCDGTLNEAARVLDSRCMERINCALDFVALRPRNRPKERRREHRARVVFDSCDVLPYRRRGAVALLLRGHLRARQNMPLDNLVDTSRRSVQLSADDGRSARWYRGRRRRYCLRWHLSRCNRLGRDWHR